MNNIKIGKIGLGAKLYSVNGKEFMLLKEYVDRRLSEVVAIEEIYVGTTPTETTKLWFDTTEEIPSTAPIVIPSVSGYTLSDFGENAINNHQSSDAYHSEKCQTIFDYVTKDFRNRCTSFQTYNNTFFDFGLILPSRLLDKASGVDADIIFTPYVNAAYWMNGEFGDFVLPVGSHHQNNGTDGDIYDDERHDLTINAETFLTNSIAVSARRDTPSEFMGSTSYGFGMEFFEDCSPEALDLEYPDKDVPLCFWECSTNEDGSILHNFRNDIPLSNPLDPAFSIGQDVWVVRPDGTEEHTTITNFIDNNNFAIYPSITPITSGSLYSWRNDTLGAFVGGQAQSWAVPIVAGKLKVIKMTTNLDWDTVRMAARATAKRNTTGIPEIDNATWDIYRGFGSIDVQAAINYINNLV